jgi:hypothetical protein
VYRHERRRILDDVGSGAMSTPYVAGRALLGVTMLTAPRLIGRAWLGTAEAQRSRWLVRTIGLRDVAIPVGYALDRSHRTAWLIAAAAADASDVAISVVYAVRRRRVSTLAAVLPAIGGAVVGASAARTHHRGRRWR